MSPTVQQLVQLLVSGTLSVALGGLLLLSLRRDPRALRNGVLLLVVVYVVLEFLGQLFSWSPVLGGAVSAAVSLLLLVSLLVLPFVLVGNGALMVRRESRSLGNLLSLVAGLGMLALPVVGLLLVRNATRFTGTLLVVLLVGQALIGFLFLVFLAHTILYARVTRRTPATAVIVLGAGLVGGKVPPLLAARLRLAVAIAVDRGTAGSPVLLVPSGGQGADESRPEGEAMGQWLQDDGVPADSILVEPRAGTTEENLRYSVELLEQRGVAGPYLVATNNYHAPRAAILARSLGIDAQAVGAPTALYFLPSAYLREFVAVFSRRRLVLALCALVVTGTALLAWVLLGLPTDGPITLGG